LLLIGLANAMLQQLGPAKVPVAPTVTGQVAKPADEKNEPMAELGLAPGAAAPSDDAPAKK
jgi:Rod binding domain-containing protein